MSLFHPVPSMSTAQGLHAGRGQTPGHALAHPAMTEALANAYAPLLHRIFPYRGRGVQVAVVGFDPKHAKQIADVIGGRQYGLAPAARVEYLPVPQALFEVPIPTFMNQQHLKNYLAGTIAGALDTVSAQLLQVASKKARGLPAPQVVTVSVENSRATVYDALILEIFPALRQDLAAGKLTDPKLADWVKRLSELPVNARNMNLVRTVNRILDNHPAVQQARSRYQQAVSHLKRLGTTIVVPTGHGKALLPPGMPFRPDAAINYFAMSPDVIRVGVSHPKGTPLDFRDDLAMGYSGPLPTLLAPGEGVLLAEGEHMTITQGSGFSAAFIAGLLALMLEANPRLVPAQQEAMLAQSCLNPRGLPLATVGYGFIDPFAALMSASPLVRHPGQPYR